MQTPRLNRIKEIEAQISRFNTRIQKLKTLSKKLSWYRLLIFITSLLVFFLLFFLYTTIAAVISFTVFLIVFGLVVMQHNKVDFSLKKHSIWIKLKKENLARINIDWEDIPIKVDIFPDENHPFESDLNISGKYSLIHLINLSVSREGTSKLRQWLTTTNPDYDTIIKRQQLIKELIPLRMFTDKLCLHSSLTYASDKESRLLEHLKESVSAGRYRKIILALSIVIPINILFFILHLIYNIPSYYAIGLLIQLAIYWFNLSLVSDLFEKASAIEDELGKFSRILDFLEHHPYKPKSELKNYCEPFLSGSPSKKFRQINRTVFALSLQKHPIMKILFNVLFPWDFFFAYRLEKIKKEIALKLPEWLNTWYNLEALISLANLGYIYPDYTFPNLLKENQESSDLFIAENAGHPLIPFSVNVRNSFRFDKMGECVIITGSNMSGKSTFLRTIGINLALCYSGAPVCCTKLNTSLFRLFSCIKISDSVTDGISYFYAEVKRLKKLLNELQQLHNLPLFYLIDEIFRGTNNLERLTGSRAFIKQLAGSKGIGLISTHDLELIKLAEESRLIRNYHFKEEVIDTKMVFDYKIHEGPCPTTNALKIMKLEGLPV